jgi:lysyl-tRNA synthetase class 2
MLAEPERLTLVEAFSRHAGVDLPACLPGACADPTAALAQEARRIGLRVAPDDGWSDLFSKILSEKIEPRLGEGRPTILTAYPVSEAALARPDPQDARFAERFEMYVCGVELANAFGELTDPAEQRRRFEADMDEKQRIYGERYPLDEDFLAALALMPPASGAALGFDRLAMLAAGAERLDEVVWTPD